MQARRDIFERRKDWIYIYFDLDEISQKKMLGIPVPVPKSLPADLAKLTKGPSGTVIVWSKYDRQPDDASSIIDSKSPKCKVSSWIPLWQVRPNAKPKATAVGLINDQLPKQAAIIRGSLWIESEALPR